MRNDIIESFIKSTFNIEVCLLSSYISSELYSVSFCVGTYYYMVLPDSVGIEDCNSNKFFTISRDGLDDDEYFNILMSVNCSEIIKKENIKVLREFVSTLQLKDN